MAQHVAFIVESQNNHRKNDSSWKIYIIEQLRTESSRQDVLQTDQDESKGDEVVQVSSDKEKVSH